MGRNRAVYLGLLAVVLATYVFANEPGVLTVAVWMAAVWMLSLPYCFFAAKKTKIRLFLERNDPFEYGYEIAYRGWLPIVSVKIFTEILNVYTGEKLVELQVSAAGKKKPVRINKRVEGEFCGCIQIQIQNISITDPLGLWNISVEPEPQFWQKSYVVMPDYFSIETVLEEDVTAMIDSENYSMYYPGNDPGETFAIREYVPGDPIKKIHWKLSQKTDKLLVREFGRPVVDETLLLFENRIVDPSVMCSPAQKDALARLLYSMGNSLLTDQHRFTVGYYDGVGEEMRICPVAEKEEWDDRIRQILRCSFTQGDTTVAGAYMTGRDVCSYSHVAVLCAYTFPDYAMLYNGNRVTVFVAEDDGATKETMSEQVYRVDFSIDQMKMDLAQVSL